jgi:hypothetical protein
MSAAEHRKPCESRGPRTALGARGGKFPPRESPKSATAISPNRGMRNAEDCSILQRGRKPAPVTLWAAWLALSFFKAATPLFQHRTSTISSAKRSSEIQAFAIPNARCSLAVLGRVGDVVCVELVLVRVAWFWCAPALVSSQNWRPPGLPRRLINQGFT